MAGCGLSRDVARWFRDHRVSHAPLHSAFPAEAGIAVTSIEEYLKLVPALRLAPQGYLWSSYDSEADVLYINFKKPSVATDSELKENDIIERYEGEELVGLTILHASQR